MLNAELAWDVFDQTQKHPDSLAMDSWASRDEPVSLADLQSDVCGTTACFASWTAAMVGETVTNRCEISDGRGVTRFAAEVLGLTVKQAYLLFCATSNVGLEARVLEIFGPRPESGR